MMFSILTFIIRRILMRRLCQDFSYQLFRNKSLPAWPIDALILCFNNSIEILWETFALAEKKEETSENGMFWTYILCFPYSSLLMSPAYPSGSWACHPMSHSCWFWQYFRKHNQNTRLTLPYRRQLAPSHAWTSSRSCRQSPTRSSPRIWAWPLHLSSLPLISYWWPHRCPE